MSLVFLLLEWIGAKVMHSLKVIGRMVWFTWWTKLEEGGFKNVGVHLGDVAVQQKNWDRITENKMEGRIKKWDGCTPNYLSEWESINSKQFISVNVWRELYCVEPPSELLWRLQAILVDFFWDGLHWVPQSMLFLPVEEGGQGLVSLLSRHAAFRLQFIQKFLTGSVDELWRENHYSESRRTGTGHCFIPHGF